ncbi:PAS domain-containing sensor histidine kinase [Ekhidna sp.]|uniref:PAS domain-containing sensor histidine kinase n=1 Tax=Ekhidna sp. TaxID=2608089 RepID=UPI003CCB9B5E
MSSQKEETIFPIPPDKMLQLVLKSIPTAIFWKNRESVYLGCNEEFAKDAGVETTRDIIGKTDYDLAWKKEEADFFVKTDQKVMSSGKPEIGIIEPQKQADGKESWLETNKVPLLDAKGEVIGILGTYNDITARVEAMNALKRHSTELEFKNNELEQFAFIAAHDLQEPLKSTASLIEYYQEAFFDDSNDEKIEIFNHIKSASSRMQEMVTGLLEYARIGRGMTKEPVDSNVVLDEVLKDLKTEIDNRNAVIKVHKLTHVIAGKFELKAIFQNLIGNALKFSRKEVNPIIEVSCKKVDQFCEFTVMDNGIGIDPAFSDKIFVIYQRLNKRSEYDGSGIGLAHCKKLVELLGGSIWLEPADKNGTIFRFTIPLVISDD